MICDKTGKIIYNSYEQAVYQKKWRRHNHSQRTAKIYKCKYCGGWHSSTRKDDVWQRKNKPYQRSKNKLGKSFLNGLD